MFRTEQNLAPRQNNKEQGKEEEGEEVACESKEVNERGMLVDRLREQGKARRRGMITSFL